MKKLTIHIILISIIINLFIPVTICADNRKVIFNCGKQVNFSYEPIVLDNKYYINVLDIDKLGLAYDSDVIYNERNALIFSKERNVVSINGTSILYIKPYIENNGIYVSLDLLAMSFSKIYDEDELSIKLWIEFSMYSEKFVKGIVSLPNGEKAPEGGITVTVFAGVKESSGGGGSGGGGSSSSGGGSTPVNAGSNAEIDIQKYPHGLDGDNLPDYSKTEVKSTSSYSKLISKKVLIEEGENYAEFYLASVEIRKAMLIGYSVNDKGYNSTETQTYSPKREFYDFQIKKEKVTVSGNICLPAPCKETTTFTITFSGNEGCEKSVVLEKGETQAEYSVNLKKYNDYKVYVTSDNEKYKRIIGNTISILDQDLTYDCNMEQSSSVSVTVTLPDNKAALTDMSVEVVLQSVEKPYYYLDRKEIIIPRGEKSVATILYNSIDSNRYIVWYELSQSCDGYYQWGHYNSKGTTFDVGNAEILRGENNISVSLLGSKTISVDAMLPNKEVAECDIQGLVRAIVSKQPIIDSDIKVVNSLYDPNDEGDDLGDITIIGGGEPVNKDIVLLSTTASAESSSSGGGGSGGGSSGGGYIARVVPNLIMQGDSSGTTNLTLPDESGYEYNLILEINDLQNNYFNKLYYSENGGSALKTNALSVSGDEKITFVLMKQNKISGKIYKMDCDNYEVRAIYQHDTVPIDDSEFYVYNTLNLMGEYVLYVPEELSRYIVELITPNGELYYNSNNTTERIGKAEMLNVNSDTENIDFNNIYVNSKKPINLYCEVIKDEIEVEISSEYSLENVDLYLAYYDKNSRLVLLDSKRIDSVSYKNAETYYFDIDDDKFNTADYIKVMAWNDKMQPLCDAYKIKLYNNTSFDEKIIADAYLEVGKTDFFVEGEGIKSDIAPMLQNDTVYVTVRAFAEITGAIAEWDKDNKSVIYKCNDNVLIMNLNNDTVTLNGVNMSFDNKAKLIKDRVFVPLAETLNVFDFEAFPCYDDVGVITSVAIYKNNHVNVKNAIEEKLLPKNYDEDVINSKNITRQQLADLCVNLYEKATGTTIIVDERYPFEDTRDENVAKFYQIGVGLGYEDGTFHPSSNVWNSELIVYFERLADCLGVNAKPYNDPLRFEDINYTDWYYSFALEMQNRGLLDNVYSDNLRPNAYADVKTGIGIGYNIYSKVCH